MFFNEFCTFLLGFDKTVLELVDQYLHFFYFRYYNFDVPHPGQNISLLFGQFKMHFDRPFGTAEESNNLSFLLDYGDLIFEFISLDTFLFIIG